MPDEVPPSNEVLLHGHEAWVAEQLASSDPARVLEIVMQCHLPMTLPDQTVMCLCHAYAKGPLASRPFAIFEGPVFHRRHVAQLQMEALRAGGHL